MRTFRSEAVATPQAEPVQGVGFGELVTATAIASAALVIVSGGVAVLVWRSVWVELSLALALLPFALLALGMLLYLRRNLLWGLESLTGRDLDGDGMAGQPERVRLVPVNKRVMVNGVDSEDLSFFTRAAVETCDWTQATWRGRRLPSGRRCDNGYHAQLVGCLVKVGIVRDYGRGTAGHLAVSDVDAALRLLGL
jgi:hypothetical protein